LRPPDLPPDEPVIPARANTFPVPPTMDDTGRLAVGYPPRAGRGGGGGAGGGGGRANVAGGAARGATGATGATAATGATGAAVAGRGRGGGGGGGGVPVHHALAAVDEPLF